jgi:uncharacterized protein YbjQ (UPF0145 family)
MSKIECARCKMKVEESKTEVIEYIRYCKKCANEKKNNDKKVTKIAKEEERNKIKEREYIERELEGITEEDIKFIIVTTTDNVEVKRIGEYINVISAQEYKYNKNFDENEKDVAEKDNRECMERALFKIKRQAYLLGADAIVGMKVYSNFDYEIKQRVVSSIMSKVNITGTAVRLIR